MKDAQIVETDFIQELRLRRWAREHYVVPEDREATWHPVVLQEMGFKDRELIELTTRTMGGSGFVPLKPELDHYLHAQHEELVTAPHYIQKANIREAEAIQASWENWA